MFYCFPKRKSERAFRTSDFGGAVSHARILAEAFFLRHEAKCDTSEQDYVSESIEQLDMQFERLKPDIPELLARYLKAHPDSFPV